MTLQENSRQLEKGQKSDKTWQNQKINLEEQLQNTPLLTHSAVSRSVPDNQKSVSNFAEMQINEIDI